MSRSSLYTYLICTLYFAMEILAHLILYNKLSNIFHLQLLNDIYLFVFFLLSLFI